MKKDLLRLTDLSRNDIEWILRTAERLKRERERKIPHRLLEGKSVGMIFNKSSTRTRISFEVGIAQLGAQAVVLSGRQLQMSRGETVADTARVLSRYLDGLVIRTSSQSEIEELAESARIPVINALTDRFHPCQTLADLLTITEKRGSLAGVKVAYIGDGNNMANSWLLGAAIMGLNLAIATPEGYAPDPDVVSTAMKIAGQSGASITLGTDPATAAQNADVLYTDTWISMGQDDEAEKRRKDFQGYCVDETPISRARPDVMVMHCLPAHRGEEISASALDGPHCVVWDDAENRLHVQKAVLAFLMPSDARANQG